MDDGDLGALTATKASKLQAKYGLSDSQVAAFIAGCQQAVSTAHGTAVTSYSAHGDGHLRRAADASADASSDVVSSDAPAVSSAAPYARTPRAPPPLPPLPSSFEQ